MTGIFAISSKMQTTAEKYHLGMFSFAHWGAEIIEHIHLIFWYISEVCTRLYNRMKCNALIFCSPAMPSVAFSIVNQEAIFYFSIFQTATIPWSTLIQSLLPDFSIYHHSLTEVTHKYKSCSHSFLLCLKVSFQSS